MFLALEPLNFEWQIMEWFYKIGCPFLNWVNWFLSEFGSFIIPFIFIAYIYWCVDKKKGEQICFATFFSIGLNNVIKSLFQAKRPFQYEDKGYLKKIEDDKATGTSFPSGHSQNSGTIYTSFALTFKKYYVIIICILMMILVPLSRLYLGVHFPRDVLVGTILGIGCAFLGYFIYNKFYDYRKLICIILCVAFLPFVFLKNSDKDFFKGFGLYLGFTIALFIPNKKEEEYHFSLKEKLIRLLLGGLMMGLVYFPLQAINHLEAIQASNILMRISYLTTHTILGFTFIYLVPKLLQLITKKKGE